ncbi:hypothetical protein FOA52_004486 [Chlamydomonas sp. UWO 241]|nr:hypothetical protein FOA52_004486 [Chlamydomonas sp. UWO 241]
MIPDVGVEKQVTEACDALEHLPPDLWAHALEQLDEKREVVHAVACCRSLLPLAGVGTMLNWELFNSWFQMDYRRYVDEGVVPASAGVGPEVLPAGARVTLQGGYGASHGVGYTVGNPDLPSGAHIVYCYRPHAVLVEGPATAGDVLRALMKQVAREKARNMVLLRLFEYVQYRVSFVDDVDGEVKGPGGQAKSRVMVDDNESEGPGAADLMEALGLVDEHLFASFAKHVLPTEWMEDPFPPCISCIGRPRLPGIDAVLALAEPDPTLAMGMDELVELARPYQEDLGERCVLARLVPAGSSEAPSGQLLGERAQRAYCALWGSPARPTV